MNKLNVFLGVAVLLVAGFALWAWFSENSVPHDPSRPVVREDGTVATSTTAYRVEVAAPPATTPEAEMVINYIAAQSSSFVAAAQAAYDSYLAEGAAYPWRQYQLRIEPEVHESGTYVSYVVREYHYTGGANGIQLVETYVFSDDGVLLELADVVRAAARNQLVEAVQAALYEVNGVNQSDGGAFSEVISELSFSDIEQFYITETELVVMFQEYDVAPGAAGAVAVPLPKDVYVQGVS